jgi:hypothetical protein
MAELHSVSALKDKYARLIGEAQSHEREAARLRDLAGNVAAALKEFAPDWTEIVTAPIQPRKRSRWGRRGGGARIYLEILRRADGPLTSLEIAQKAAAFDIHGESDKASIKALVGPINRSLGCRLGKGVVRHEGKPLRWSLMRPAASNPPTGG